MVTSLYQLFNVAFSCCKIKLQCLFLFSLGVANLNFVFTYKACRGDEALILFEEFFQKLNILVTVIACIVRDEKHIAAEIVDLGKKKLLLLCKREVLFPQEENVGIVAEYSAVEMTSEYGVRNCILSRGKLKIDSHFVIIFR